MPMEISLLIEVKKPWTLCQSALFTTKEVSHLKMFQRSLCSSEILFFTVQLEENYKDPVNASDH